ncbi:MAG: deoxyribonuclease IV [Thermoleophilia bacterium]
MRFGAHVSSSGGISNAIGRGLAIGCESLQVFTHNPRTWRPINHTDDQIAAFRDQAGAAGVGPIVSHGLYLINLGAPDKDVPTGPPGKPATKMRNIHRSSVESLIQHLQVGERLGLAGVVLHVGSSKGSTEDEAIARIGRGIAEALQESPGECDVLLENTAGAGDTIGRTFAQLRRVFDEVGAPKRLGYCLDTQHLFASGYPVHEEGGIDRVLEEFDQVIGIDRLRCLHLNDSLTEFGSNRDRHANIGDGLIGEDGMRRILGCPALQGLPVVLEVPGISGDGPDAENMQRARRLHAEGLELRA